MSTARTYTDLPTMVVGGTPQKNDKNNLCMTILIVGLVALALWALMYAWKDNGKNSGGNGNPEYFSQKGQPQTYNALALKENACGGYNSVRDGYDTSAGQGPHGCGPVPEPHKPHTKFGASHNAYASTHYHDKYPNEQSVHTLQAQEKYGCAPDSNNAADCDYALNTDNLMPGSWREGDQCPDGSDPNSQWAKYHPTKEAYWRYITAAGSARTAVNTRIPWRIVGQPLLLRPGTATPLTHMWATPFGESSLRQDVLADAHGYYPEWNAC